MEKMSLLVSLTEYNVRSSHDLLRLKFILQNNRKDEQIHQAEEQNNGRKEQDYRINDHVKDREKQQA